MVKGDAEKIDDVPKWQINDTEILNNNKKAYVCVKRSKISNRICGNEQIRLSAVSIYNGYVFSKISEHRIGS